MHHFEFRSRVSSFFSRSDFIMCARRYCLTLSVPFDRHSNAVGDGTDDDACVLLDHIPHNDCCEPDLHDPTTYTPYTITVMIPNIICERCSLHLSNPATDMLGEDGAPLGIGCVDPGECYSVYRSCTKAFRIIGDDSRGAVKRSDYECPTLNNAETGWPSVWTGDNGEAVDASIPGLYRRESSVWSEEDSTLTTAPWQFQKDAGETCVPFQYVLISINTTHHSFIYYLSRRSMWGPISCRFERLRSKFQ